MDDNKMPGPVAWSTPGQFRPWATRESERVMKLTKEEQPEHDFITPLYSAETVQALQSECEEQARLNGMGAEREARLMARVSELQAERDALAKDAARYRWLRERWGRIAEEYEDDRMTFIGREKNDGEGWYTDPDSVDAAIDAAMAEGER